MVLAGGSVSPLAGRSPFSAAARRRPRRTTARRRRPARAGAALAWPPSRSRRSPGSAGVAGQHRQPERPDGGDGEETRGRAWAGWSWTPIYGVRGEEARFIKYLSPEWVGMLEHTLRKRPAGMGVDMSTGTGWPSAATGRTTTRVQEFRLPNLFAQRRPAPRRARPLCARSRWCGPSIVS